MNIRQALQAEHSKPQTMKIVTYIGADKNRFAELMKIFFAGEYRLEHVRKLKTKGHKSTRQAQKSIATLGQFFPIHDQAAEAIKPGVRAFHYPTPRLAPRMRRRVLRPSARRRNVRHIIFAAQDLARRFIVIGGIQTQMLGRRCRGAWSHHGVVRENGRQGQMVIDVGRRYHHAHRHAAPVYQHVIFHPGFGPIGRIRPVFFPPSGERT